MNTNNLRRLNWLWKNRHTHVGDTTQSQITVIKETIETIQETVGATDSGAYVHLERVVSQEIDAEGEAIEWDRIHGVVSPFEISITVPTDVIMIPKAGYYDVHVDFDWDTWTNGGAGWVTRTRDESEITIWPPAGQWTATYGQRFQGGTAPAIPCEAGDTIRIYVDHNDSVAHDLRSATCVVEMVERASSSSRLYHEVVLADSPVGYWQLDELSGSTAVDSASSHDGTFVGSPLLNQVGVMQDGSGSSSIELNGSSQWVVVPVASVLGLTDLTVEAWINFDVAGNYGIFNVNKTGGDIGRNRWGFWRHSTGVLRYADTTHGPTWDAGTTLTAGTTYHVAFTRTAGGVLTFYLNGIPDGSHSSVPVGVAEAGDTAQIGMDIDSGGDTDHFDGRIDEVAVYGRVLSPAEIAEHYNVGSSI